MMKIKIQEIKDRGNDEERLVLRVFLKHQIITFE